MNTLQWAALAAAALMVLLAWRIWRRRPARSEQAGRPRKLAHAELVYMERLFRIHRPLNLMARIGRAY